MVTILYKGESVGYICKRIAATNPTKIRAVQEDARTGSQINGLLLRWDSKAPQAAQKTLNTAEAIRLCRNKRESRLKFAGLCPPTITSRTQLGSLTYPALIRPHHHYAAKGFHVVSNELQASKVIKRLGVGKWYASPIIKKSKEFRVFVFQGRCVQVARRYCDDPNQIAWNIAVGGKTVKVRRENWPLTAIKFAIEATKRVGLDYAAVDVIIDQEGNPFTLEANSSPGLDREETIKKLGKLLVWAETHEAPPAIDWNQPLTSKLVKHPAKLGETD